MPLNDGTLTVLDLKNELTKRLKAEITKKQEAKLIDLNRKREKRKAHNYKVGARKRKLRRELENPSTGQFRALELEAELENPPIEWSNLSLKDIDNQMKMITKGDFEYHVSDSFGDTYSILASDLMKKENAGLFIVKKFKRKVDNAIEKEAERGKLDNVKILNKLLEKINYNIELIETGDVSYPDETLDLGETYPPIIIDFVSNALRINV